MKGLRQRRVGNAALVLIEFAGGKESTRQNQHPVQFVDHRGFADPGISGDQHEFRRAPLDDAVEGGQQGLDLARPSVQLLGDQEAIRRVLLAERKGFDAPLTLPFGKTAPKVILDAKGGLVARLGGLGEQLHDDPGNRGRDIPRPLLGRLRLSARYGSAPTPWARTP